VPTVEEWCDAEAKLKSAYGCSGYSCYNASSAFEGQSAFWCYDNGGCTGFGEGAYASSTWYESQKVRTNSTGSSYGYGCEHTIAIDWGTAVRCVRNY
jgi:hypothetical protein